MGKQWAAQWKVNSLTDPGKVYTVSVAKAGRWACDCPAHRFCKAPKVDCKHIRKVQGVEQVKQPTTGMAASAQKLAAQVTKLGKPVTVVVNVPTMLVIQTRREICLEEEY